MEAPGNHGGVGPSPTGALPTEETSSEPNQTWGGLIRTWFVAHRDTEAVLKKLAEIRRRSASLKNKQLRTGIAPDSSSISKAHDALVEGEYTNAVRIAAQDIWLDGVRCHPQQPGMFHVVVSNISSFGGGYQCTYTSLNIEPHQSPHCHRPRSTQARRPRSCTSSRFAMRTRHLAQIHLRGKGAGKLLEDDRTY